MGTLLTIDGLNIVRRMYEANAEANPADKADNAIKASLFAFKKLVHLHKPSHVLAAFDQGGLTWRHALYSAYKQTREPMPEALRQALPSLFSQLNAFGICTLAVPEVEADDVIATTVLRWLNKNKGVAIIVSTDKDLLSLIHHGATVWDYFKNEWHDATWVKEKFGVSPELLPQLLALAGDSADNIPGVSQIGLKTAARLLNAYKNIDAILKGAGILKTTLGAKLRKDAHLLELSQQLVALKTDVYLDLTWNKLIFTPQFVTQ
jgi:5'-3' exonuclease